MYVHTVTNGDFLAEWVFETHYMRLCICTLYIHSYVHTNICVSTYTYTYAYVCGRDIQKQTAKSAFSNLIAQTNFLDINIAANCYGRSSDTQTTVTVLEHTNMREYSRIFQPLPQ